MLSTPPPHPRPLLLSPHSLRPPPPPSANENDDNIEHQHLLELTDEEAAVIDAADASLASRPLLSPGPSPSPSPSPSASLSLSSPSPLLLPSPHSPTTNFAPAFPPLPPPFSTSSSSPFSSMMGTGRSFSRGGPTARTRLLLIVGLALGSIWYLVRPESTIFDYARQYELGKNGGYPRNQIQFDFKAAGRKAGNKKRAEAVRQTMKDTFWKYREAAWGMDEVRPVSGGNRTSRNGWAATIVDTLTTTAMMGLMEEFMLELNFTLAIDFNHAIDLVDPFETTIRYLGSLVSTVDLIDSKSLTFKVPKGQRDALLAQAQLLADKLAPSFDSPTGMVWPRVNWTENIGCREHPGGRPYPGYPNATIGPARAGSNWLENMSLSRLVGDRSYGINATKAWKPLVWSRWQEDWPGLIDGPWDIMTGTPYDRTRSWDAGHDSYYEYLIKAHIMIPSDSHSQKYRDRWLQAVDSTESNLVYRAKGTKLRFLHQWRNGWLLNEMGHLACFAGGNIMMGGKYLGKEEVLKLGSDLVETCHHLYATAGKTKIGPEYVSWLPDGHDGAYEPITEHQMSQQREKGYWIADARWLLRPETVESYFYAYRITGEQKYADWAWEAYEAMVRASKSPHGYAEVQDVAMEPGSGNQRDKEESFWGAETLKYLWMTFEDEEKGDLDHWVFSTEAHPFRVVK